MNLYEQIISIAFSFLYGIVVYYSYVIIHKYLYSIKKIYSFFNSLLFMLNVTIIYFIIMRKINDGIINLIFVLITISTFLLLSYFDLQKKCKNMTNRL